jgi:hypothetical protein
MQISIVQCRREIRANKSFARLLGKFSKKLKSRFLDVLETADYILVDFSELAVSVLGGVLLPVFYLSVLRDLSINVKNNRDLSERLRNWRRRAVERRATRFGDFNLDVEIKKTMSGLRWISKRLGTRPLLQVFNSEFLPREAMAYLRLLGQSDANVDIDIYGSPLTYSRYEEARPETNREFFERWRGIFAEADFVLIECVVGVEESVLSSRAPKPQDPLSKFEVLDSLRLGPSWGEIHDRFAGSWGALILQVESPEFKRAIDTGIGIDGEIQAPGPSSQRFDHWWRLLREIDRKLIRSIAINGGTVPNVQLEQMLLHLKVNNPRDLLTRLQESSGLIVGHSSFVRCANSFLLGQILKVSGTAPETVMLLKETNWISIDFNRSIEFMHRDKLQNYLNADEVKLVNDFANRLKS